jgi:hypothetical protein
MRLHVILACQSYNSISFLAVERSASRIHNKSFDRLSLAAFFQNFSFRLARCTPVIFIFLRRLRSLVFGAFHAARLVSDETLRLPPRPSFHDHDRHAPGLSLFPAGLAGVTKPFEVASSSAELRSAACQSSCCRQKIWLDGMPRDLRETDDNHSSPLLFPVNSRAKSQLSFKEVG